LSDSINIGTLSANLFFKKHAMTQQSLAIHQIKTMLTMQDAMNTKVSNSWKADKFAWYRAIWVECAEMLDHYGWKWWKHQRIDVPQVQLELVDIFHFGLSLRLMENDHVEQLATILAQELTTTTNESDFTLALESLAASAVADKQFNATAFADCMRLIDMDLTELFRQYVGKNTLNFFRQDHGYKTGSYIKVWQGQEDNEVLAEIVKQLDPSAVDFQQQLHQALTERYPG
jgi:dimeric dUTPase (all-alpha-NTP-PPase superfamily)